MTRINLRNLIGRMRIKKLFILLVLVASLTSNAEVQTSQQPKLDFIQVSHDGRRFIEAASGKLFHPWGFNYDHDSANRLLETYWVKEWATVESDFAEMKALGANTVRIHLQVSRFMESPTKTNSKSLAQLAKLLVLAEKTGLYLDITGLGCYDKIDVPRWYNKLNEENRWAVQSTFGKQWPMSAKIVPPSFATT